MERGHYKRGEKVLVLGAAGGVGLSAVQIAHAHGAFVIGGDISEEKRELARSNGADAVIDLAAAELPEALRKQVFEGPDRSEAHTSELQSLMRHKSADFCLTKKKQTTKRHDQLE